MTSEVVSYMNTKADALAVKLNDHLANGGCIQITTYLRSTLYQKKHAGWFSVRGGEVHVAAGKRHDCLTFGAGEKVLVGIRLGRVVESVR
jgi:hypothetical protein